MISDAPAPAALALPSFGPLLGAAYDRAVTLVVRSWRVIAVLTFVVAALSSLAGASITYPVGKEMSTLPLLVWTFFAMANALRAVFEPSYRMDKALASNMFGSLLSSGILIVGVNVVLIFELATHVGGALLLFAVPGIVVGLGLSANWTCAAAIAARGCSASKSLSESWRLASHAFWATFAIFVLTYAATLAIGNLPDIIWNAMAKASGPFGALHAGYLLASTIVILIAYLLGQFYIVQANAVAVCMWLKALETAQPAEPSPP
jgi:hypothetical protein